MLILPSRQSGRIDRFDVWISAVGYEARSRHAFADEAAQAEMKIAIDFLDNRVLAYDENLAFFRSENFEVLQFVDRSEPERQIKEMSNWVRGLATALRKRLMSSEARDDLAICVDVSVMSRDMMALTFEAIWLLSKERSLSLHLRYSPTNFYVPRDSAAPISFAGSASPLLAGWRADSQAPVALILGLGFEGDRTIWASEILEPARTLIFAPLGYEQRFDDAMLRVNRPLFEGLFDVDWILDQASNSDASDISEVDQETLLQFVGKRLIPYNVGGVSELFVKLDAACFALLKEHRVIICPFGPKIFSAVSMLVALAHFPRIAVWRVSGNVVADPEDRAASGPVVRGAFRLVAGDAGLVGQAAE